MAAIAELIKAGRIGNRIRALGLDLQRDFLDLFTASAGDFLDGWFESAPIKAAFGFDSIVGNYASPYMPGSAYVLLHHSFGEVNGKKGIWGHAIGGMGAITQAMAKAAATHGVDIRLSTRVRRVLVENGRAIGVETDKGETVRAAAVAAGINPKLLYLRPRRSARPARAFPAAHGKMALRLGHVSHECRAFRIARLHRSARTRMLPNTMPRASSSPRASPIWSRPISTRVPSDGRAVRSSNWSFHRQSTTRLRRADSTSRACSASTSRRSCPTARHGTTTVKPSPIS